MILDYNLINRKYKGLSNQNKLEIVYKQINYNSGFGFIPKEDYEDTGIIGFHSYPGTLTIFKYNGNSNFLLKVSKNIKEKFQFIILGNYNGQVNTGDGSDLTSISQSANISPLQVWEYTPTDWTEPTSDNVIYKKVGEFRLIYYPESSPINVYDKFGDEGSGR